MDNNDWISVEDELPRPGELVKVSIIVDGDYWTSYGKYWWKQQSDKLSVRMNDKTPTHWMRPPNDSRQGDVMNQDIEQLSDQEKSVLLARARGWYQIEEEPVMGARWKSPDRPNNYYLAPPNLYKEKNFALAWKMLNWAGKQGPMETATPGLTVYAWAGRVHSFWGKSYWTGAHKLFLHSMSPADAQRLWLDKILELSIEAGIITLEKETE